MNKLFIFQNVNINCINFVNNKNDLEFVFIDSIANSGQYSGELLCVDILSLSMNTDLDDYPFFPQFICDVSIEQCQNNSEHILIKLQGGSYDFAIICKDYELKK